MITKERLTQRAARLMEYYNGKSVLVTGASGLVGSHVVSVLKRLVPGVHITGQTYRGGFQGVGSDEKLADDYLKVDLLNMEEATRLMEVVEPDTVFSCAGITGGIGLAFRDPLGYVGPATSLSLNTLHSAVRAKVKNFSFASSATVYPPSDEPCKESDDLSEPPYHLYAGIGESKRFIEKMMRYYSSKVPFNAVSVRPSGIYGRRDNFDQETSHVLPGMVARAVQLGPTTENTQQEAPDFEIWGDGQDIRDFVHAEDAAMVMLLATAAEAQKENGTLDEGSFEVYNAGSSNPVTTRELAQAVVRVASEHNPWMSNSQVVCDESKPSALKVRKISVAKAEAELGYQPLWSLEDGIADAMQWYKEISDLKDQKL